jgi:serine O-acetyltransferase
LDEEKKAAPGFNAYGIGNDHSDPVNKALHGLIGHSVTVDQRIEFILEQLEKMGVRVEEERATADKFDPNHLNKIVD